MGKTILTAHQLDFLELAQAEPFIVKNFYLTGGTALAAFYYHHRLSEDIDLFCEDKEVDAKVVEIFLKTKGSKIGIMQLKGAQTLGLVSFVLHFRDGGKLKVDFNYYPFPGIEKGKKYINLKIDSVYDIAANKLHTIFMKPRVRDYFDLYFILKKEKFDLDSLIINSKAKFDWDIDRVNLASQFIRIKEFIKSKDYPKMLVPFDPKKMVDFFLKLAKSLEKEIFK